MSNQSEQWRPYPPDPRYSVSTEGRVKGLKGYVLKPQAGGTNRQYRKVHACGNPNQRVDYMVLETFVGPRPAGMECCHANDIQSDNRLCNLRWDSHQENCKDRDRNGRMEDTYRKTRKASRREISLLREAGLTFVEIASLLSISPTTACRNLK